MILESSHTTRLLQQESMRILTHGATEPSRLKTFVTPFGWGNDLRKQIANHNEEVETDKFSTAWDCTLVFTSDFNRSARSMERNSQTSFNSTPSRNFLASHSLRKVWMIFRFVIITGNSPKQLEKHCITKGQYLSHLTRWLWWTPFSCDLPSQASVLVTIQQASQSANGLVEVEWTWENPGKSSSGSSWNERSTPGEKNVCMTVWRYTVHHIFMQIIYYTTHWGAPLTVSSISAHISTMFLRDPHSSSNLLGLSRFLS